MDIERNVQQATADVENVLKSNNRTTVDPDRIERIAAPKASLADFRAYYSKWSNLKILIGCAYSWFALDVCSLNLYRSDRVIDTLITRLPSTVSD